MKNTYSLTFRGEHIATFTSVHAEQAVMLGYAQRGSTFARLPKMVGRMKTVAALKRAGAPSGFNVYADQTFIVRVFPGTTEITAAEVAA